MIRSYKLDTRHRYSVYRDPPTGRHRVLRTKDNFTKPIASGLETLGDACLIILDDYIKEKKK